MDRASRPGRLEVRSRQIISDGGHKRTEFTVYCPFRQGSLDLDQCQECTAFSRTTGGPEDTARQVGCLRIAPAMEMPDPVEMVARASLQRTPASRLMTRHVVCVHEDLPLREVPAILLRHRIGGIPVVDGRSRPVGMVTKTDLLRQGFEFVTEGTREVAIPRPSHFSSTCSTANAMSHPVVSVGERDSLLDVARLMATRQVQRLAVTSRDGRIVGLVSSTDVLRFLSRELPRGEGVAGVVETD
jgi:CBS domain-containing protein